MATIIGRSRAGSQRKRPVAWLWALAVGAGRALAECLATVLCSGELGFASSVSSVVLVAGPRCAAAGAPILFASGGYSY